MDNIKSDLTGTGFDTAKWTELAQRRSNGVFL
jgi:hypothetical protein